MTTVDPEGATPEDPQELRRELDEARDTLRTIRSGAFDALVIDTGSGDELFTLSATERPHRLGGWCQMDGFMRQSEIGQYRHRQNGR